MAGVPKYLDHFPAVSWAHLQGAGSEVERAGLELMRLENAGVQVAAECAVTTPSSKRTQGIYFSLLLKQMKVSVIENIVFKSCLCD